MHDLVFNAQDRLTAMIDIDQEAATETSRPTAAVAVAEERAKGVRRTVGFPE